MFEKSSTCLYHKSRSRRNHTHRVGALNFHLKSNQHLAPHGSSAIIRIIDTDPNQKIQGANKKIIIDTRITKKNSCFHLATYFLRCIRFSHNTHFQTHLYVVHIFSHYAHFSAHLYVVHIFSHSVHFQAQLLRWVYFSQSEHFQTHFFTLFLFTYRSDGFDDYFHIHFFAFCTLSNVTFTLIKCPIINIYTLTPSYLPTIIDSKKEYTHLEPF